MSKKDMNLIKPHSGVAFIDAKGKKEEGPEVLLSPGRMTRSNYSKVANVRISSDTNSGALSEARLGSPTSTVTSPTSAMFKDRVTSI